MLDFAAERDPFEEEAKGCYIIERYLSQTITPNYPVAKFQVELEMWNKEQMQRKKEARKLKNKSFKK